MKVLLPIVILLFTAVPLFAAENPASQNVKQGFEQLKAGKPQQAIKSFEAARRIDPSCADAYEGIGEAYLAMGDNDFSTDPEVMEKGANNLKIAIKLNPNMASAHYKLATSYLALNDKNMATKEYEILKKIDKEKAPRLSAQISKYKAPNNYRFMGSTGTTQGSRTNYGARTGGNGTQIATGTGKQGRFTGTVELFVTSWCPSCKRAIAYMKEKDIPYVAYDVESDAQARKRFEELGGRGYPLILVGDHKFYGSDPKTIDYYTGR
jgi:glutaredoxin